MKRILIAAAAAASLTACSSLGMGPMGHGGMGHAMPDGSSMAGAMPGMMMPTQANAYVRMAAESDLYEITSARLALERTQNPELRRFATQLIDHHTRTTNATLAAARAGRLPPQPAVLGPQKRAMINQLQAQAGMSFDRLFIQQQVPAHEEALALHTNYARAGDVGSLRGSATAAIPFVQGHLNQARSMHAAMGGM